MAHPYRDQGQFVLQPEVPLKRATDRRGWLVASLLAHVAAVLLVMQCSEVEQLGAQAPDQVSTRAELRQLPPRPKRYAAPDRIICRFPWRPRHDEPARVEPHKRGPATIPAQVLLALRISGERNVVPSSEVRRAMQRDGVDRASATVKLCVGADGVVSSARVMRSTKYAAYDSAIVSALYAWRLRPYTRDGIAVPGCSAVTFVYRLP